MYDKSDFIVNNKYGKNIKLYKKSCDECGDFVCYSQIKRKKSYCKPCQYKKLSETFSQPKIEVPCAVCGKALFYSKSQFKHGKVHTCSKVCNGILKRKDITEVSRNQLKSKMIQAGISQVCVTCGHTHLWNLQAHHRVFVSNGGTNNLENLEFQCRNCHADIHIENEDKEE